tara:strand:+ start:1273 stop:1887 length:615 start_codon:yes stop_codon:yes gene_type:complete
MTAKPVRRSFLTQAEIDAILDLKGEVVRSLSDIDVMTIEDFADLALEDVDLQPGKLSTMPVSALERVRGANAFNDAMISQGDFQLAAGTLDGSFFHVIGSHKVFALLERMFPATGYGTVGVVDPADFQAEITDLTGKLEEEKSARGRDVAQFDTKMTPVIASYRDEIATLEDARDDARKALQEAGDKLEALEAELGRREACRHA